MGSAAETLKMTAAEFLAFDEASSDRHEFVRGEVFAMAGTTDVHNDIVSNLNTVLRAHLRGRPYRVHFVDVKLRVEAPDAYFLPDVFVTCDPRDREDTHIKRHPTLIIEVLSERNADYDQGAKFREYRRLDTLREYVLVDSRVRRIEVFRKSDAGIWELHPVEGDAAFTLVSVGLTLTPAEVYDDTEVPAEVVRDVG